MTGGGAGVVGAGGGRALGRWRGPRRRQSFPSHVSPKHVRHAPCARSRRPRQSALLTRRKGARPQIALPTAGLGGRGGETGRRVLRRQRGGSVGPRLAARLGDSCLNVVSGGVWKKKKHARAQTRLRLTAAAIVWEQREPWIMAKPLAILG